MTLLQLGIGTVNDVVDAPFDAGRKPGKPIPAGIVPIRAARALAVLCFVIGVGLSLWVRPALGAIAVVVVAIGLAYDLRLKGTAWSWLPFAVGIPILPVFGWLGTRGELAPAFAILVPAAVAAGAALAIGNSLVDVERDRAVGRTSAAARLGPRAGAFLATGLFLAVALGAGVSVVTLGGATVAGVATFAIGGIAAVAAAAVSRAAEPGRRELAWRAEALGTGLLAVAWIAQTLR